MFKLLTASVVLSALAAPAIACEPIDVVDAAGDTFVVRTEVAKCSEVAEFVRGYAKDHVVTAQGLAHAIGARFGSGGTVQVDDRNDAGHPSCDYVGS